MTAPPSPSDRPIEERFSSVFEDPPPPEAPTPENTEVSPTPPEPSEELEVSEEPEATDSAEEVEAEAEEGAEEALEEAEPEGSEIRSDSDVAEALGVELSDLHEHLQIKLGDESVSMKEVIERASQSPPTAQLADLLGQHNQNLAQAEERREQEFQANNSALVGLTQHLLEKVEGEAGLSEASLAALKIEDPEQWAVKQEERRQVFGQIDANIRAARDAQGRHQAQQAEVLTQRHAEQGARMLQAVPEWAKDPEFAFKEATEIAEFIQSEFNFTPEEMGQMPDHRLALAFRRLYLLEKKEVKTAAVKKTLEGKKLKASKSLVPTRARKAKVDAEAQRLDGLKRAQRDSAFDVERRGEHEQAAAERFARLMD